MNELPPAGGFGQQPAPMAQVAFGPMAAGTPGVKPRPQNAFVVGILPLLISFFGSTMLNIIAAILGLYMLSPVGTFVQLGCIIWYAVSAMRALDELRRATNNPTLARWPTLIPLLGSVYWLTTVPGEVRKSKELSGLQPVNQSLFLYLLFPVFAIQRDLNEL